MQFSSLTLGEENDEELLAEESEDQGKDEHDSPMLSRTPTDLQVKVELNRTPSKTTNVAAGEKSSGQLLITEVQEPSKHSSGSVKAC